jgi:hypothetical protein
MSKVLAVVTISQRYFALATCLLDFHDDIRHAGLSIKGLVNLGNDTGATMALASKPSPVVDTPQSFHDAFKSTSSHASSASAWK